MCRNLFLLLALYLRLAMYLYQFIVVCFHPKGDCFTKSTARADETERERERKGENGEDEEEEVIQSKTARKQIN